jgi:periplasmic divalent cation tolerance protein
MPEPAPLVPADDLRILLTTAPPGVAHGIAKALVEGRLAACVNLLPGPRSVYRWQGAVRDDPETLVVVKTSRERLPALASRLRELHPYEIPEMVVLAPEAVSEPYLAWLLAETSTAP